MPGAARPDPASPSFPRAAGSDVAGGAAGQPAGGDPAALPPKRADPAVGEPEPDAAADRPEDYARRASKVETAGRAEQRAFFDDVCRAARRGGLSSLPNIGGLLLRVVSSEMEESWQCGGRGRGDDPAMGACRLLDTVLKNGISVKVPEDDLVEALVGLARVGAARGESECPRTPLDSRLEAVGGVNGMSFVVALRYALERAPGRDVGLGGAYSRLRSVVDEYLSTGGPGHTLCRHAAIGLFMPAILHVDREWARAILGRLGTGADTDAAFWSSCVSFNDLHEGMFAEMLEWYDRFLNERDLECEGMRDVVDATFQHVALAYLYDLDGADGVFDRYVEGARPEALGRAVFPLSLIMRNKGGDRRFNRAKVAGLWERRQFKGMPLDMWFRSSPLDKRTTMRLYRAHLEGYTGRFDLSNAPVSELGRYADECPEDTAWCIIHIVGKADLVDYPAARKAYIRPRGLGGAPDACGRLRDALLERGYDPDADDDDGS